MLGSYLMALTPLWPPAPPPRPTAPTAGPAWPPLCRSLTSKWLVSGPPGPSLAPLGSLGHSGAVPAREGG